MEDEAEYRFDGYMTQDRVRTVWFSRDYQGLTGGHVKHSHYFDHVLRMPGFAPKIAFRGEPSTEPHALERRALWPAGDEGPAARWEPGRRDVLFLAGVDWRYLAESGLESLPNPRINLIQHVRHAHEGTELHRYLAHRAIRICVSREVADAVSATGRVEGPILTIPNGIDVPPATPAGENLAAAHRTRPRPITIVGYKRPDLARALSRRLDEERIAHPPATEFLDRRRFLERLAESRVAVCLPHVEEGFYLPALEAMAAGCLVVTLACIGNRGFCLHEENCLIAEPGLDSLFDAAKQALALPAPEREGLLRRARDTAAGHSLDTERARFHAVLEDVDRLWRTDSQDGEARAAESPGPSRPVPSMPDTHRPRPGFAAEPAGSPRPGPAMPDTHRPRLGFAAEPPGPSRPDPAIPDVYRPRLGFMIVGAQKCGTTALARFLSRHPEIGMADPKEAHLFDAPDYSGGWSPKEIDARYRPSFEHCPAATVRGEATPIYMLLPEVARELHRYNPELKLIVLLRDPVERAISHYYMERGQRRRAPAAVAGPVERAVPAAPLPGRAAGGFGHAPTLVPPARPLQPPATQPLPALRQGQGADHPHPGPVATPRCRPPAGFRLPRSLRGRADSPREGLPGRSGKRRPPRQATSRRLLPPQALLPAGVRPPARVSAARTPRAVRGAYSMTIRKIARHLRLRFRWTKLRLVEFRRQGYTRFTHEDGHAEDWSCPALWVSPLAGTMRGGAGGVRVVPETTTGEAARFGRSTSVHEGPPLVRRQVLWRASGSRRTRSTGTRGEREARCAADA